MADSVREGRTVRRWADSSIPTIGLAVTIGLVLAACSSTGDDPDGSSAAASGAVTTQTSIGFGPDDEPDGAAGDTDDPGTETTGGDSDDNDADGGTDEAGDAPEEMAAAEAEIERVIQRNWEIWVECTTDIEECDPATALAETEDTTSRFYAESVGVVELWQQQGIAYRPVEGRPADRFVEIRSIDIEPDLSTAEVVLCDRDDRARFQRNVDGDYDMVDGTDIGEDLLLRRVLVNDDGGWKIAENELLDRRHVQEGIDPLC